MSKYMFFIVQNKHFSNIKNTQQNSSFIELERRRKNMIFAYLRVSTDDKQDFDRQLYILKNSGYCIEERNLFFDKKSGKDICNREQYQILKKIVRAGDIIVCTELSRFSRNYNQIAAEMAYFKSLGVKLIFLDMPFLNNNADDLTQQLITDICINLFSYVAEQERLNTSKRIKQKLNSLKENGTKLGRPSIILSAEQKFILDDYINKVGNITGKEAAQKMHITLGSFYKQLKIYKNEKS